jgi:hypothetical protein
MALKFRRGTTAQQSGSLAFGEPYVNTTLGTLLIGGPNGDIILGSSGTGSTGNFGAISGSGLDITGNANIAGNLTLGGAITIGDASSDTVNVVASLSSSLIPQTTNAFDLGSATKFWRDLYISTGSIKMVNPANNQVVTTINAVAGGGIQIGNVQITTASIAFVDNTGVVTQTVAQSSSVGSTSNYAETSSFNAFTSSQLTQNTALATISGSLILTASANTVSVANLNTTTASLLIETANLESFTSSINTTIKTQLDSNTVVSGSSQIAYASISSIPAGIVSGAAQVTPLLPTGTISGSSQLSGTSITDLTIINLTTVNQTASVVFSSGSNRFGDAGNDTHSFTGSVQISGSLTTIGASTATSFNGAINATNGVVSGSSQVIGILSSLNTYTGSNDTTNTTQTSRLDQLSTASGSAITRLTALEVETSNLETFTSSINTTIKTRLNAETVISGSSQVVGSSITTNTVTVGSTAIALGGTATTIAGLTSVSSTGFTGALTGNASTATTLATARTINGTSFNGSADITIPNLVSGSSQITAGSTTGFATGVKTQLDANTVVSGSGQINVASTTGDIALGTRTSGNYVASLVAGTNITLSNNSGEGATPTIGLTNNTISGIALGSNLATLTIGTGLSGTSYNGSTGVTIANTGVTSNVAGTGVTVSGATGAVTISIGQAVATSDNVRFNSLGIGMAATGTAGRIDAANDIVAFSSSDIRFKENIKPIENAIDKIRKISGNTYDWKEENKVEHGYEGNDVGVIAQEIEAVLPQLVQTRESGFKAVKYDKLVALLIEGIKEQQLQIEQLRIDLNNCTNNKGL